MKQQIEYLLAQALENLQQQGIIPTIPIEKIHLEHTRNSAHGDYASNIAIVLAKTAGCPPRELAQKILAAIPSNNLFIKKIELAGPGFINFFLTADANNSIVQQILQLGNQFGHATQQKDIKINLEFVSSNPTGPLHVGHGRSAAYGSALANILAAAGYQVHREYYVNDAGRQIDILTVSVWLRYLEICGATLKFPSNAYQGDYVRDIAQILHQQHARAFLVAVDDIFNNIPLDLQSDGTGDKEAHIDGVIAKAKQLLGQQKYQQMFDLGLHTILDDMRNDLHEFGVDFDEWFSERELSTTGALQRGIEQLTAKGHTYVKEGALWFRSTELGDEKDRVLRRANGQTTYFAADVAYHMNKYDRGYNWIIDVLGADHHGYVPRIRAVIKALGGNVDQFTVAMIQFVSLYRGNEKVSMSTRSGSFISLRELREEVGKDATRFFYLMRKHEQHLDFDLALAKSHSAENPVYYIQYAHARICSVFRQAHERKMDCDQALGLNQLSLLTLDYETNLLARLTRFPEMIIAAAQQFEPFIIANYLRELAVDFHTYYNAEQFLVPDNALRQARLCLITAIANVLRNGLSLLGLSAPEEM